MQPNRESFSIVMLGSWNPSIFSTEWVLKHLADEDESEVELAYPLDDPTAPRKITFEGISMFPGRKRLMLNPVEPTVEGMEKCAKVAFKIISLLSHTPIGNMGVNFSFTESENTNDLDDSFFTPNLTNILGEYVINQASYSRSLSKEGDDFVLSYSVTQSEESYTLSYNFNYSQSDVGFYKECLESDIVKKHYDEAVAFSVKYHNIELEEG